MYYRHIVSFLFNYIFIAVGSAFAQQVFDIPADQVTVDGLEMNIRPGDSVLLEGGARSELRFENLTGTAEQPIIIAVKDEKVVINTDAQTGILFLKSAYFHMTGTGTSEKYGIEVASSGSMGISVTEFSTDCEIDHIEIHNTGFAGIMAKTDPYCDRPDLSEFVMKNLSFHDNHIYDTEGEGYYVGYSWYPTREVDCDGNTVILYPHSIQGLKIYNNDIHDTGWDGLQVGSATANVRVYGNRIARYGLEGVEFQTGGVQISASSVGDLYNNFIYDGIGGGVSLFGGGNNRLYNNLIMNTGGNAIYQNDRDARPGTSYKIYNNTIINPGRAAIELNTASTRGNLVANNLMVLEDGFFGIQGDNTSWENVGNQLYGKIEEVGFEHPDTLNFRLTETSKAVDVGHVVNLDFDHIFNARPANGKYDVGAFEYGAEPYVPAPLNVDPEKSSEVVIFPNPSNSGPIKIRVSDSSKPDFVAIYDHTGSEILSREITWGKFTVLELEIGSRLKDGIYFVLMFENGRKVASEKLILKTH